MMKVLKLMMLAPLLFFCGLTQADMNSGLAEIQHAWAVANYQTAADDQELAFEKLVAEARKLAEAHPDSAEPKIWLAIVLSTDAGITGGLGALGKVKEARKQLEAAAKINPDALDGSIYTSLGSLYYQVPGWPIGFGDDEQAEQYLKQALALNPDGIDPNYFYGDFMLEEGNYQQAVSYLEKAAAAAPRSGRELADKGRKAEVHEKLEVARKKI